MKKVSLIVSILLTLLVFSMSFASGSDSGSLSLGITNVVYDLIYKIFPNAQINLDNLHLFIRKTAHVSEYALLGFVWFQTMKYWNLSLFTALVIGLTIAGTDETIQKFAVDRGPSVFDALVFDFLPFASISILLYFINHRKGEIIMASETLMKLQSNTISAEKAYKDLYKEEKIKRVPFFKRAHFIKLSIKVPDQKGVNAFLRVLFLLPIPILFLRIVFSFVKVDNFESDIPLSKREIMDLIAHRGVKVKVNANGGEKVYIKTF